MTTTPTVTDDRAEALYRTLDLIRLGDGTDETIEGLRIAGLASCWDGVSDLAAHDGYATGDPMDDPFLTPLVLDIWTDQALVDLTDDALRDVYLDMDGVRYGYLALDDKRAELRSGALARIADILRAHDDRNRDLHVQRFGLIAHHFPACAMAGV